MAYTGGCTTLVRPFDLLMIWQVQVWTIWTYDNFKTVSDIKSSAVYNHRLVTTVHLFKSLFSISNLQLIPDNLILQQKLTFLEANLFRTDIVNHRLWTFRNDLFKVISYMFSKLQIQIDTWSCSSRDLVWSDRFCCSCLKILVTC